MRNSLWNECLFESTAVKTDLIVPQRNSAAADEITRIVHTREMATTSTRVRRTGNCCRFVAGYVSVFALITAWVAQSEISQALQTGGFNQPIALVWLNHSILVLLLPLTFIVWHSDRAVAALLCRRAVPFRPSLFEAVWRSHRLSRTRLLITACGLAIIYFLADLVWYCALPHLSVATGTAIFNSSCAFTFAFGAWLLRERVSALKIAGVVIALVGVVVIALFPGANMAGGGDARSSLASRLIAAALVLSAALLYGYYEVLFKVVVESGLHLPRSLCEMLCGCGFARAESRALLSGVVDDGRSLRSSDELDLSSRSLTVEDALLPRGILQTPPRGDAAKREAANLALSDAGIEGLMPPDEIVVAGMGADVIVTNITTGTYVLG